MDRIILRLGRLMADLNLNDVDLVWMTGIRQGTISKLISGYADQIKLEHLGKIMTALEADITEIIEVQWVGEEPRLPREGRYERVNRNAAYYKEQRKKMNAEKRKNRTSAEVSGNAKPKSTTGRRKNNRKNK